MFCPRCGRPVNPEANFCGGCGLSKVEIEKYMQQQQQQNQAADADNTAQQPESADCNSADCSCGTQQTENADSHGYSGAQSREDAASTYTAAPDGNAGYAQNTGRTENCSRPESPQPCKDQNLSTVDFIWMIIISGLPVIGLVYLIYMSLQNDNINKRSYARAMLIISVFSVIIALVFFVGIIAANIIV